MEPEARPTATSRAPRPRWRPRPRRPRPRRPHPRRPHPRYPGIYMMTNLEIIGQTGHIPALLISTPLPRLPFQAQNASLFSQQAFGLLSSLVIATELLRPQDTPQLPLL